MLKEAAKLNTHTHTDMAPDSLGSGPNQEPQSSSQPNQEMLEGERKGCEAWELTMKGNGKYLFGHLCFLKSLKFLAEKGTENSYPANPNLHTHHQPSPGRRAEQNKQHLFLSPCLLLLPFWPVWWIPSAFRYRILVLLSLGLEGFFFS